MGSFATRKLQALLPKDPRAQPSHSRFRGFRNVFAFCAGNPRRPWISIFPSHSFTPEETRRVIPPILRGFFPMPRAIFGFIFTSAFEGLLIVIEFGILSIAVFAEFGSTLRVEISLLSLDPVDRFCILGVRRISPNLRSLPPRHP